MPPANDADARQPLVAPPADAGDSSSGATSAAAAATAAAAGFPNVFIRFGKVDRLGDATNGVYLVEDPQRGFKGVFKPRDEEVSEEDLENRRPPAVDDADAGEAGAAVLSAAAAAAPTPAGRPLAKATKTSVRRGLLWGETARNELAAYCLDHGGFAGVPKTTLAHVDVSGHGRGPGAAKGLRRVSSSASNEEEEEEENGGGNTNTLAWVAVSPHPAAGALAPPSSPINVAAAFTLLPLTLPQSLSLPAALASGAPTAAAGAAAGATAAGVGEMVAPLPLGRLLTDESTSSAAGDGLPRGSSLSPLPDALFSEPQFKFGSLQQYCEHVCSAEDMGSALFPIDEVHKIGILDVRLLNLDRHLGNILVRRHVDDDDDDDDDDEGDGGPDGDENSVADGSVQRLGPASTPSSRSNGRGSGSGSRDASAARRARITLTPIDHGYCLPSFRDLSDVSLEWVYWPQCRQPFSPATRRYVASLRPLHDAQLLAGLGVRDESIVASILATTLLQRAVCHRSDLTLFDVARLVQREGARDRPSVLERLIQRVLLRHSNGGGEQQRERKKRAAAASASPGSSDVQEDKHDRDRRLGLRATGAGDGTSDSETSDKDDASEGSVVVVRAASDRDRDRGSAAAAAAAAGDRDDDNDSLAVVPFVGSAVGGDVDAGSLVSSASSGSAAAGGGGGRWWTSAWFMRELRRLEHEFDTILERVAQGVGDPLAAAKTTASSSIGRGGIGSGSQQRR